MAAPTPASSPPPSPPSSGWIVPAVFDGPEEPPTAAAESDGMVTVFFATEYDTAEIVVNILANTPTNHYLYPLAVKYQPSDRVRFVLQTQACPDRRRVGAVMICRRESLSLARFLDRAGPLPASDVAAALDLPATERLYAETLEALRRRGAAARKRGPGANGGTETATPAELRYVAHFDRQQLIQHLNATYLTPTSPSWFMAAFDPHVGTLILTMHYYLFEREWSTAQTTRDYTRSFVEYPGPELAPYVSMSQFMQTLLRSPFVKRVPAFNAYARQRNARDHREHEALDDLVNRFRDPSRLPAALSVHYVYLAYRRALSYERIAEYCRLTEYDPTLPPERQCRVREGFLAARLHEDLLGTMEGYFSSDQYFRDYVRVSRVPGDPEEIAGLRLAGYGWDPEASQRQLAAIPGSELRVRLRYLNQQTAGAFEPVSADLRGLLAVCASARGGARPGGDVRRYQREYLFDSALAAASAALPLFRVETLRGRRQTFYVVARERSWWRALTAPEMRRMLTNVYHSDEILTESVWLPEPIPGGRGQETHAQLLETRHEIFNEHLPAFNFVGDMDLHVHDSSPDAGIPRRHFFDALRALRRTLLRAWRRLFDRVDERAHPVFFYKSACEPDARRDAQPWVERYAEKDDSDPSDPEDAEAAALEADEYAPPAPRVDPDLRTYCRCRDKIGLRVVIPFPAGTAVVGAANLRRLARILNHAIVMDPELFARLQVYVHLDECFDPTIYRHGRSIRLPFMSKLSDDGLSLRRRLTPVYIVPETARADPLTFVRQHFDPRNFCHHAASGPRAVVSEVVDRIEDTGYTDAADRVDPKARDGLHRLGEPEDIVASDDEDDDVPQRPPGGFLQSRLHADTRPRRAPFRELLLRHLRRCEAWRADGLGDDAPEAVAEEEEEKRDAGRRDGDPTEDELTGFVRHVAWPRLVENADANYRTEAAEQLAGPVEFRAAGRRSVLVQRRAFGRACDFVCLNANHRARRENVRLSVSVFANARWEMCATLWTRCFTAGCGGNVRQAQATVVLPTPQY